MIDIIGSIQRRIRSVVWSSGILDTILKTVLATFNTSMHVLNMYILQTQDVYKARTVKTKLSCLPSYHTQHR